MPSGDLQHPPTASNVVYFCVIFFLITPHHEHSSIGLKEKEESEKRKAKKRLILVVAVYHRVGKSMELFKDSLLRPASQAVSGSRPKEDITAACSF
jgi:hypothetical protein